MSYLKPQLSFSLNFALLFNVMRDNSSVLSWLKLYMILQKELIKVQNFRKISTAQVNLYFRRLLLLKAHTISAKKKYTGVMPHDSKN